MQRTQYFPALFSLLFAAGQNHQVGNDGHPLANDRKGHEKPHGSPHRTEIAILMAIDFLWEVVAGTGEGGASSMQAVGIVDLFTAGLEDGRSLDNSRFPTRCALDYRTVSLSQLIHRGIIILVKVAANAVQCLGQLMVRRMGIE